MKNRGAWDIFSTKEEQAQARRERDKFAKGQRLGWKGWVVIAAGGVAAIGIFRVAWGQDGPVLGTLTALGYGIAMGLAALLVGGASYAVGMRRVWPLAAAVFLVAVGGYWIANPDSVVASFERMEAEEAAEEAEKNAYVQVGKWTNERAESVVITVNAGRGSAELTLGPNEDTGIFGREKIPCVPGIEVESFKIWVESIDGTPLGYESFGGVPCTGNDLMFEVVVSARGIPVFREM